jgi:hypothetical protein
MLETLAASKKIPDWHPIRCILKTAGVAAAAVGRSPRRRSGGKVAAASGQYLPNWLRPGRPACFSRGATAGLHIVGIYTCPAGSEKEKRPTKWTTLVRATMSLHPRIPIVQQQSRRGDDPTRPWRHFISMRNVTLSVVRSDCFVIARVEPTPGPADQGTNAQVGISSA